MAKMIALLLFAGLAVQPEIAHAGSVRIVVTGMKSADGEVRCSLFREAAGFPRKPEGAALRVTAPIRSGSAVCLFEEVPSGPAAVSVIHDANNNKKLDLKFGIIPREGLGWSNNPEVRLSPPSFEAARFQVGNSPVSMTVKLLHR
jgi:uncharacterized protein (DUF2141 family)